MEYIQAFLVGGAICTIGQLLIDKTTLMSARILVIFVCLGVVLGAIGIYEPLIEFGGAGAIVPLTGFGNTLASGVMKEIDSIGFLGIFIGGLKSCAGGLGAIMLYAVLASLCFDSREK